jgi:hypothetical protein
MFWVPVEFIKVEFWINDIWQSNLIVKIEKGSEKFPHQLWTCGMTFTLRMCNLVSWVNWALLSEWKVERRHVHRFVHKFKWIVVHALVLHPHLNSSFSNCIDERCFFFPSFLSNSWGICVLCSFHSNSVPVIWISTSIANSSGSHF